MAVKKRKRRNGASSATREEKITRLSAQLAPLEEHAEAAPAAEAWDDAFVDGSIIVDGSRLPTPDLLTQEGAAPGFRIEPVVIVVTVLALSFIAFITYLISNQAN